MDALWKPNLSAADVKRSIAEQLSRSLPPEHAGLGGLYYRLILSMLQCREWVAGDREVSRVVETSVGGR